MTITKVNKFVSVLLLISVFLGIYGCDNNLLQQSTQSPTPTQPSAAPSPDESPEIDMEDSTTAGIKELSITYGIPDENEKYGNIIQYYTYNIDEQILSLGAEIPFSAQYAVGAIFPYDEKLYYSQRSDDNNPSSDDHLLAMNLADETITTIDDSHYSYNDIVVIDESTVLATAVAHDQTIQPTIFGSTGMIKLFDAWFTEKYTLRPNPINYNHSLGTFVGVYVDKSDFESLEYRRDGANLDHYVAVMGIDPEVPPTSVCALPLKSLQLLNMAVQISENEVLISIIDNEALEPELAKTFYIIDFSDDTAVVKEVDYPFPDNFSVSSCLVLNNDSQMVCLGSLLSDDTAVSGLFLYDWNTEELQPIITNELGGHVINYVSVRAN